MTIDIIIPVYNCEDNIGSLVKQIINQNVYNDSIILIDDGSHDESLAIMKKLEKENNNIKLIQQENQGPAIAREVGLQNGNNNFVWFIDSDDTIAHDSLNILHSVLESSLDMILFGINVEIFDKDIMVGKNQYSFNKQNTDFFNEELFLEMINKKLYNSPCNKVFSRQFLIDNKIHFKKINLIEDAYFITQVLLKKPKIRIIEDALYYYKTKISSSKSVSSKYYPDRLERGIELNQLYNQLIKRISSNNKKLQRDINSILVADIYTALSLENNNHMIKKKIDYLKSQNATRALIVNSNGETRNLKLFRLIALYMPRIIIYYYIILINRIKNSRV